MVNFGYSSILTKLGFFFTFISNSVLIYLTLFHVKKVFGTYKRMILGFALSGILLSAFEIMAQPFAHNFNGSMMFFSSNAQYPFRNVLRFLTAAWGGLYMQTVAYIAILFLYRYYCLFNSKKAKNFDGLAATVFWAVYTLSVGASYTAVCYIFCPSDEYSVSYVREEILRVYGLSVSDIPRFLIVPYFEDGSLHIANFLFLVISVSMITFHYAIILYCGVQMSRNMNQELKKFSVPNRKLQRQFFKALIVQSLGPTVLLILPVCPILLGPFIFPLLEIEVSLQTGWLYSLIGLYPPFDSIAFMMIVSEYKMVIKRLFGLGRPKTLPSTTTTQIQLEQRNPPS